MGKQYQPRTTTSSSMAHIGILALAITAFVTVVTPECCIQKNYGGEMYTLRGPEDMQEYPCKDGCYYTKDGMPGSRFCFKQGGPMMSTCDISMCTNNDCYMGNPCCDSGTPPCNDNPVCTNGAASPVPTPFPTPAPAPFPGCTQSDCVRGNICCDDSIFPCDTDPQCGGPPAPVPAPVPAGCTNNDCIPGNACCDNGTPPCNDNPQCGGGSGSGSGCTNNDCIPGNACCEEGLPPCDTNPQCGDGPPAPVPTPVSAPVPAPMGMGDHGSDGMGDHSSGGMGDHNSGGMDGGMGMGDHGRK